MGNLYDYLSLKAKKVVYKNYKDCCLMNGEKYDTYKDFNFDASNLDNETILRFLNDKILFEELTSIDSDF